MTVAAGRAGESAQRREGRTVLANGRRAYAPSRRTFGLQ